MYFSLCSRLFVHHLILSFCYLAYFMNYLLRNKLFYIPQGTLNISIYISMIHSRVRIKYVTQRYSH